MTDAPMDHRPLHELRLRDFRCFREQQAARLAPLTLLVGENSTGKTSFLAAMRATLEVANYNADPDFRASPYDLGSFFEIAYRQRQTAAAGELSRSLSGSDRQERKSKLSPWTLPSRLATELRPLSPPSSGIPVMCGFASSAAKLAPTPMWAARPDHGVYLLRRAKPAVATSMAET